MIARLFAHLDWHPAHATLVAGVLVLGGFFLTEVNWGFLSIAALGTFGPGILREFGFLNDQDEFQRRAARRAGYHAFLTAGLFTFLLVSYIRSGERNMGEPEAIVTLILAVLWFTWFLSSLLSYWGPQKTVSRILTTFGAVWLVFVLISHILSPIELIMESLVVIPFFLLAYISRRWPKIAGICLIAAACFFFYLFGLYEIFGENPLDRGRGFVIVMFEGPLLVSGIILLRSGSNADDNEEEETEMQSQDS
ncbi:hypothetical protein HQ531_00035 [bacterium]|nr:hypothetical protein [bacterium]